MLPQQKKKNFPLVSLALVDAAANKHESCSCNSLRMLLKHIVRQAQSAGLRMHVARARADPARGEQSRTRCTGCTKSQVVQHYSNGDLRLPGVDVD